MDINFWSVILTSVGVILATQGVKWVQAIPINQGQTARVRTFVGVLTFLVTAITYWSQGKLETFLTPELISVGVAGVISWALAHFGYRGIIKPLGKKSIF